MDILVRGEKVVHDHEMDLTTMRELHAMEAVKAGDKSVRVVLHVLVVLLEDRPQELMLRVVDRLNDEPVVAREVKERSRLARRAKFRQDILGGKGQQVVGGVEVEVVLAQLAKDPWGVVLELEVVLCGGREFVTDTARRLVRMPT